MKYVPDILSSLNNSENKRAQIYIYCFSASLVFLSLIFLLDGVEMKNIISIVLVLCIFFPIMLLLLDYLDARKKVASAAAVAIVAAAEAADSAAVAVAAAAAAAANMPTPKKKDEAVKQAVEHMEAYPVTALSGGGVIENNKNYEVKNEFIDNKTKEKPEDCILKIIISQHRSRYPLSFDKILSFVGSDYQKEEVINALSLLVNRGFLEKVAPGVWGITDLGRQKGGIWQ